MELQKVYPAQLPFLAAEEDIAPTQSYLCILFSYILIAFLDCYSRNTSFRAFTATATEGASRGRYTRHLSMSSGSFKGKMEEANAGGDGDIESGSQPTVIHVQAQEVQKIGETSSGAPLSVKGRDLMKDLRAPIAVAQPFDINDHYGHIATGGRGEDEGSIGASAVLPRCVLYCRQCNVMGAFDTRGRM